MIDMNDFRYFVAIVDRGGFTSASHALQLPTSTLSYRIKQLEERLGIVLLVRTSRRLSLTEAGNEFYRYAQATVENANEAEYAMRTRLNDPTGTLRYTIAPVVAQFMMPTIVNSFLSKYPEVTLVQHVVNQCVDIVGERFDLAIRIHSAPLPNSNLIQKTLGHIPWCLYASPSYLARHGHLEAPNDLVNHQMLLFSKDSTQPRLSLSNRLTGLTEDVAVTPRLLSSCMICLMDAAKAGIGITALPTYLCGTEVRNGDLKVVLPGWLADNSRLTALMPYRIGSSATLRAFIDHVAVSCHNVINCQFPEGVVSAP